MHDILRDTPIYQEILREGLVEGREQGIEQGKLEAFRHVLLIWTEKRFPSLLELAQEQAARIQDTQVLDDMIAEMSVVHTIEEASSILKRTGKNA